MAKPRNKVLDYLQYVGLRLFATFVHMFSHRANYRTARWVGEVLWRVDKRHRDMAIHHLQKSFPDWPIEKVRRTARLSVRNLCYLGVEFLWTTRLITPATWRRHIKLANIAETIRLLLTSEKGVLFVTGHFGNWEVVGYTMATLGFPTVSIARHLDNPYVHEYAFSVREKTGMRIVDKRGASDVVDNVLEHGGAVGVVADQDAGRKGAFVDFFGRKASTYKLIALMAIRYDVPIVVGYGRRLNEDYCFEMGIERVIYPREWADQDDPMMWITQEYTHALEATIRRAPEQYLWMHRRWKHRPKGEPNPPDGVA